MKRRARSMLFLFFLMLFLGFQVSYAERNRSAPPSFKVSRSGLEVSDYKKVVVSIELDTVGPDVATHIDLGERRIGQACKSRLIQTGLEPVFEFIRPEYLHVNIKVTLHAFSILLQFRRPVFFEIRGTQYARYGAPTWQRQITGTHGGGPDYIFHSLGLLLDSFLKDYLKANVK